MEAKKRYIIFIVGSLVLAIICYISGTWTGNRRYTKTLEESRNSLTSAQESEQRAIESANKLQEQNNILTEQLNSATNRISTLEQRISIIAEGIGNSLQLSKDIGDGIDLSIGTIGQSEDLLEQLTRELEYLRNHYSETK